MAFEATDLMIDVFPERAEFLAANCITASPGGDPKPAPCPAPSCQKNSARAAEDEDYGAELPALAVLRERLRQALHP
jgi:hypothetical protein